MLRLRVAGEAGEVYVQLAQAHVGRKHARRGPGFPRRVGPRGGGVAVAAAALVDWGLDFCQPILPAVLERCPGLLVLLAALRDMSFLFLANFFQLLLMAALDLSQGFGFPGIQLGAAMLALGFNAVGAALVIGLGG